MRAYMKDLQRPLSYCLRLELSGVQVEGSGLLRLNASRLIGLRV